jgi:uncharacterized protein YgiM (DUF1202 family)
MADIDRDGNKNFTVEIMKTNCWLILGLMVATGAFAQTSTNALPPMTAPTAMDTYSEITNPPPSPPVQSPKKSAKHKKSSAAAAKKIAFHEPTVTLQPGPAEVVVSNLNVRGQAGLKGEVVAHFSKGETVTVLSQINLDKHSAGEPAQWAKIALPVSTKIWVRSTFIDSTIKTVLPKRLNLRAGPGENFSVLGVIERGTPVNKIITKGDWTQIEPPTNAYAFVAAMYLKQEASGNLATNPASSTETEPMPAPTPTPVPETQPAITEPPTNAPAATEINSPPPMVVDTNAPPVVDTNLPPPPPRIVTHEGVVGHVGSIIAPTAYELYDPETRAEINYLYTTSTNLNIGRYDGMRIIVTGEEGLAERWGSTPLLTIQSIMVVDTNAIPKVYYPSPRQRR